MIIKIINPINQKEYVYLVKKEKQYKCVKHYRIRGGTKNNTTGDLDNDTVEDLNNDEDNLDNSSVETSSPYLIFTAGPTGSGKSSILAKLKTI